MPDTIRDILKDARVVLQGHFLLTSGRHSPTYLEKFRLLQFPPFTERLCGMIADRYGEAGVQVVAGPALGGVILAYEVARQLGVRSIYAERVGERRGFRRGLSVDRGERVLVVDDVLTTGGSVREVIEAVAQAGGSVLGLAVLIDRSDGQPDFDVPMFSCYRLPVPTYAPDECPGCAEGLPLTHPGSSL